MLRDEMAQVIKRAIRHEAENEKQYRVVTVDNLGIPYRRIRIIAWFKSDHLLSPYEPKVTVIAYIRENYGAVDEIGRMEMLPMDDSAMAYKIADWMLQLGSKTSA